MNRERFAALESAVRQGGALNVALPVDPTPHPALAVLAEAQNEGWIRPHLVGKKRNLAQALERWGLEGDGPELHTLLDSTDCVTSAIELVRAGGADLLLLPPEAPDVHARRLRSADPGFFTGEVVAVAALALPDFDRLLFVADLAVIAEPDVARKAAAALGTARVARAAGVVDPKAALLAAVEVVSPAMPVTGEAEQAAALAAKEGLTVQGPLSFDLAVNARAVEKKKASGAVPGRADVLIAPNMTVARGIHEAAVSHCGASAGIVFAGGPFPVAAPGRADGREGVRASLLLAGALIAGRAAKEG